jgi:NitT/TauT family transport system substrate-binding protein
MRKRWCAVLGATALAVSACGGADDESNGDGSAEDGGTRTVTVGMLPILPTAALHAGIEEGFFEEQGLELQIETGQGGAALLPAVASGQLDFATSNPVSLLQARERGLDAKVIAHWTSTHEEGDDASAVVAPGNSGISTAQDLSGKTVAVNTLQGMGGLTIREAVRKDGGDPQDIEFVELGFPDMPAAMEQGNIDAAWVPEPFITMVIDSGGQVVTYPGQEAVPGHPTQMFFTSGQLAESDPELVESMTTAVNDTLEFAEENPDAVLAAADFLEMEQDLLERVRMEAFGSDLRKDEVTELGQLMHEDGLLEDEPDIEGLYELTER